VFRFLLAPRWVALFLVVIALGYTCTRLSEWQFHRYRERHDSNQIVRTNLGAKAEPVERLLNPRTEPTEQQQWRLVTARGHWDAAHQIAILYRTRSGNPGVNVVTPLVTSPGHAVLVDRGWIATAANGNETGHLPAPASGLVSISGRIRIDADGSASQVQPSQGSVRALSAAAVAPSTGLTLDKGFLQLVTEQPRSPAAPAVDGTPGLGGGPSFFYGWQWLFFALLFFGFYCYFAYAEYQDKVKGRPRGRDRPSRPPRAKAPMGAPRGAKIAERPRVSSRD
jgi:cytochrome oxidase assembly protein ShyY1